MFFNRKAWGRETTGCGSIYPSGRYFFPGQWWSSPYICGGYEGGGAGTLDEAEHALVGIEGGDGGQSDPGEVVGFFGEAERFIGIGLDEKPDVVVNMGGFSAAGGDGVGIDVENTAVEQGFETGEAGFLADFAEGIRQDIGVTVAMTARLEPEAEFGVVSEESAGPGGVHDPGGGGDVTGLE
jgi:hypothetical protein